MRTALVKQMQAAEPEPSRPKYRRLELNQRPRGQGPRTTLSAKCAKGKHTRCTSLTCQCDCPHGADE